MRKAFSLVELMVAIGLLALVLSFAGLIFRVSIESHRTGVANAEIMQKLRVITDQLDSDFRGLVADYGGHLRAHTDTYNTGGAPVDANSDCIAFFANGDFQSTGTYSGQAVAGNVACIFYGQPDPNSYASLPDPLPKDRILLRRQTILTTSDEPAAGDDPRGEYYRKSLVEWQVNPPFTGADDWVRRPVIDPNAVEGHLAMYVAKGVDNFTIEYAQRVSRGRIRWYRPNLGAGGNISTQAFKFTFTLYDSKAILKNGRTFTHVVYLGG